MSTRFVPAALGLLAAFLLLTPARVDGGGYENEPGVPPHELHESYADLAIEGDLVAGTIRFFKKDLERALGPILDSDAVSLSPGPEADALVLRYLGGRLTLVAAGDTLSPTLVRAEEVRMGHHPAWEVALSWVAPAPVADLRVRSTLLFEVHQDQRNILRFVRLPGETRATLTLEPGAEEGVVGV